uniref:Uncharacterized protein n=1 Tax=Cacopsylla melanoneura TaxID=428564 RepID=A0A8D8Q9I9_9HEMI
MGKKKKKKRRSLLKPVISTQIVTSILSIDNKVDIFPTRRIEIRQYMSLCYYIPIIIFFLGLIRGTLNSLILDPSYRESEESNTEEINPLCVCLVERRKRDYVETRE